MLKKSIIDYALDPDDVLLRDLIVDELHAAKLKDASVSCELTGNMDHPSTNMASTLEEIGWIISNCDEDSTEASTCQEEFDRLQVLKKYSSMDMGNDETLDQITSIASLVFPHDYIWVLLMDLRVSWVVSSQGLGGLTECPRNLYFPCAHALRTQHPVLMVEDLLNDPRFVKSPFALGPFGARFYAAAPLISPEGYRIGVFGVASKRPSTLSPQEQQILHGFASLTMRHLVDRRRKIDLEERLKKAVACTSHDIMTPLMGLQLSLASLKEDADMNSKLSDLQRELLSTADNCVTTMCLLGKTAMQHVHEGLAQTSVECHLSPRSPSETSTCQLGEFIDRLHQTLDPIEKSVPLMINLDGKTPPTTMLPDLKVFRAAVALLCLACSRTKAGFIVFQVAEEVNGLVFACESSSPPFLLDEIASFIDPNSLAETTTLPCLRLAANSIRSIGGSCGYSTSDMKNSTILWFKVPCHASVSSSQPPDVTVDADPQSELICDDDPTLPTAKFSSQPNLLAAPSSSKTLGKDVTLVSATGANVSRKKKVLVIDDSVVVRKSLERALSSKFGYEVALAEDGKEGLARLQESVYDIVLMDFLMPVMDGWDCTQQYRLWEAHHRPWFRQLIIGMSAHAGDQDVHRATQFGMDDDRCKPVTIKTLTDLTQDQKIVQVQKQLDFLLPMFGPTGNGSAGQSNKRRRGSILCLSRDVLPRSISALSGDLSSEVKVPPQPLNVNASTCLVCRSKSAESPWSTFSVTKSFEQNDWNVELVQSHEETLARLKRRNYDAVIVENELAQSSAVSCIAAFREWEASNRVNRQRNVLLQLSSESGALSNILSNGSNLVQPPAGFDGVLNGYNVWEEFDCIVGHNARRRSSASVTGIVLR